MIIRNFAGTESIRIHDRTKPPGFSPDARWIVYSIFQQGIFVQPFPGPLEWHTGGFAQKMNEDLAWALPNGSQIFRGSPSVVAPALCRRDREVARQRAELPFGR